MKVAVFGDSFADVLPNNPTPNWVQNLSSKYDITNFARGGSSLFYSLNLFEKNNHNYDKIVFVVTNPGRLVLPAWPCFDNIYHRMIPGPLVAKNRIEDFSNVNSEIDSKLKNQLLVWQAALDYFKYVQFQEFDTYVHNLMFDQITKHRPDTIIIPSFQTSHHSFANKNCMIDIQTKEDNAWGIEEYSFRDIRNSHMTLKNNEIFAEKVCEWLNGKPVDINLDDFVIPSMKEKDFYFRKFIK